MENVFFYVRAKSTNRGGARRLEYLYKWRDRQERERRGRGGGKEGDREKGIRAGITLGDCSIVNPCRVALVLLLFLSPTVSLSLLSLFLFLFLTLFTAAHPFR